MDSSFHIYNLSANRDHSRYQPKVYRTIARRGRRLWAFALGLMLLLGASATHRASAQGQSALHRDGFAPPEQNLLSPLLALAPPGQAALALDTFDRIHALDRKLILHPVFSPELQKVIDHLPAPELIPIELPMLYGNSSIPWLLGPAEAHYLAIGGRPEGADYVYGLLQGPGNVQEPDQFAGVLRVEPESGTPGQTPASVAALFGASLYFSNSMSPENGFDTTFGFQREIYGTMSAPWDGKQGVFNQHDQAMMARVQRDLPATLKRLNHYLKFNNLLDEFHGPSGPWVLVNIKAEVRDDALAPFPHLRTFWHEAAGHLEMESVVRDEQGRRWLLAGVHRGVMTLAFILRNGMLTPMDAEMRPAGAPLEIAKIGAGHFYLDTNMDVQRFGMRIGLDGVRFAITYGNHDGTIHLDSRMAGVPILVAPPIIHPLTVMLAGRYLDTLARGNGGQGVATTFAASPGAQGGTMLSGSISAELLNAPALELLARIASALAPDYGSQVREEQRRLTAEFFDAFDSDYHRARRVLLGDLEVRSRTPGFVGAAVGER
jgi:hypothetical protein